MSDYRGISYTNKQSSVLSDLLTVYDNYQNLQQPIQKHHHSQFSKFFEIYTNYFKQYQEKADNLIEECINDLQWMIEHKILIKEEFIKKKTLKNNFIKPVIQVVNISHYGAIVNYYVYINKFRLNICLLNIKNEAQKLKNIGFGAYGLICAIPIKSSKTVAKRTSFTEQTSILQMQKHQYGWKINPNKYEIENAIYEFSIYKLCSFFKIGPRISNKFGFDVLCYENLIEFYMEECKFKEYNINNRLIYEDLKIGLRVLHKYKIIHKDIKPSNIMFSPTFNKFIFIDFGISQQIVQEVGQLTLTYKQGTIGFMCQQMQSLKNKPKLIDLYYNDLYGLITTLQSVKNHAPKGRLPNKSGEEKVQKLNNFYEGITFLYDIVNYNEEKLVKYSKEQINKFSSNSILKQIMNHFSYQQIKKTIQMNPFSIKDNILIIQNLFAPRKFKCYNKIQIQFLIRTYGFNRILLSFHNQFEQFDQKLKFINVLRHLEIQSNNLYDYKLKFQQGEDGKNQLIKNDKKQLKLLQLRLQKKYSKQDCLKYLKINLELLVRGIKIQFDKFEKIKNQFQQKSQQKTVLSLINCQYQICKAKNPQIQIFYRYFQTQSLQLNAQQKIIIYQKLIILYQQLHQSELIMKYEKILKNISNKNDDKSQTVQKIINKKQSFQQQFRKYFQIGRFYKLKNQIKSALVCFFQAIQYGIFFAHNDFVQTLNQIGICYQILKDNDKFESFSNKAFEMSKNIQDQILSLSIIWNVIQANFLKKNYQKVQQYCQKSLNIAIKNFGNDHINIVKYYTSFACLYMNMDDFQNSLIYCTKSLKILSRYHKNYDITYMITLQIVGCIFYLQKKNQQALQLFTSLLNIKLKIYGEQHQQIVRILNHIGHQYMQIQEYEKQIQIIKKSIQICQKIKLNNNHYIRAYGLLTLAYLRSLDYQNFSKLAYKNIEIINFYYGENSSYLAYAYMLFGQYYLKIKQYRKSIEYYQEVIRIKSEYYGKFHFDMIVDYGNISQCYFQLKDYPNTISILEQSINKIGFNKIFTDEQYIKNCFRLCDSYQMMKMYEKEKNFLQQLLYIKQFNKQQIIFRLGNCYYNLGKYEKVIYFYTKFIRETDRIKNKQQINFCKLKLNQSKLMQYLKSNNKKYLKNHMKINLDALQILNISISCYLQLLYFNILQPEQSIFILFRIVKLQKQPLRQKYIQLYNQQAQNYNSLHKIISNLQIICNQKKKKIVIKNKSVFQQIKIFKRFLLFNRRHYFNPYYQLKIKNLITKLY